MFLMIFLSGFFLLFAAHSLSIQAGSWGAATSYNPMGSGFLTQQGGGTTGVLSPAPPSFLNGSSGFSDPSFAAQRSQGTAERISTLPPDAEKIVAKWKMRIRGSKGNASSIRTTADELSEDKQELTEVMDQYRRNVISLHPEDQNTVAQILLLFDLLEMSLIATQAAQYKPTFVEVYDATVRAQETDRTADYKAFYVTQRDRLKILLSKFSDFLAQNPTYRDNPPEMLSGLKKTLDSAQKAFEQYAQFLGCLEHPSSSVCSKLGRPQKQMRSYGSDPTYQGLDQEGLMEDQWARD